jgi:transcriptional regulator with XRE-family HTH domain
MPRRDNILLAYLNHGVYITVMDKHNNIRDLVRKLISVDSAGHTGLAAKLNVSESTVSRWKSGATSPRPSIAGKLRTLANKTLRHGVGEPVANYDWLDPQREDNLQTKIHATLTAIRESLHRSGRLSSRNEALDEVSKLLFAHVISITHTGKGISPALATPSKPPARALREFVAAVLRRYIPTSLSHEVNVADFELKLKDSENTFAGELMGCFHSLDATTVRTAIAGPNGVDVLNNVFGQFLAASFSDEKELGQYLTPNEVVRFMTRLGINSLSSSDYRKLIDPDRCTSLGHILDPSCGVGSFLTEVLKTLHADVVSTHGISESQRWVDNMLRSVIVGIDKSERMVRLSLTNLALFGSEAVTLHLSNALARDGHDGEIASKQEGTAILILTNPPFGAEFSGSDIASYKIAKDWSTRSVNSVDSELLFIERYIDWLAPGGVLVAIVPDSILTNRGIFRDLRAGLSDKIELRSVISLPPVTFGAAGTTTKTSILHLIKRDNGPTGKPVYYAICNDIGYEVTTRASQRRKISNGRNELVTILPEALGDAAPIKGRFVSVPATAPRWDAAFHVGMSSTTAERIEKGIKSDVYVRDVASLSTSRVNPARSAGSSTFLYIEISDVNSSTLEVTSKAIPCDKAPSRARKLVRAGNVLVSSVRPERRTVAVVPEHLNGAVCSTGFAVLECHRIDPTVLALLLQSDFVNEQVLRNNIGIAYPAISEECLLDLLLPISASKIDSFENAGMNVRTMHASLLREELQLRELVSSTISAWQDREFS